MRGPITRRRLPDMGRLRDTHPQPRPRRRLDIHHREANMDLLRPRLGIPPGLRIPSNGVVAALQAIFCHASKADATLVSAQGLHVVGRGRFSCCGQTGG